MKRPSEAMAELMPTPVSAVALTESALSAPDADGSSAIVHLCAGTVARHRQLLVAIEDDAHGRLGGTRQARRLR